MCARISHAALPCFKGFARRFLQNRCRARRRICFWSEPETLCATGLADVVVVRVVRLLFGFVFLCPLGPLSVRSRRPYENLWFCANSSGAKNVEEISTKVFTFFFRADDRGVPGSVPALCRSTWPRPPRPRRAPAAGSSLRPLLLLLVTACCRGPVVCTPR